MFYHVMVGQRHMGEIRHTMCETLLHSCTLCWNSQAQHRRQFVAQLLDQLVLLTIDFTKEMLCSIFPNLLMLGPNLATGLTHVLTPFLYPRIGYLSVLLN